MPSSASLSPTDVILDILNRLQFEVKLEADGDTMQVVAPRWREDIEVGEPDLAEEVIREYGYEHIVPTFLKLPPSPPAA